MVRLSVKMLVHTASTRGPGEEEQRGPGPNASYAASDAGLEATDPDMDADLYADLKTNTQLQQFELCFHHGFVASPLPVSLHFDGNGGDSVLRYPAPLVLTRPTPPSFIYEVHDILDLAGGEGVSTPRDDPSQDHHHLAANSHSVVAHCHRHRPEDPTQRSAPVGIFQDMIGTERLRLSMSEMLLETLSPHNRDVLSRLSDATNKVCHHLHVFLTTCEFSYKTPPSRNARHAHLLCQALKQRIHYALHLVPSLHIHLTDRWLPEIQRNFNFFALELQKLSNAGNDKHGVGAGVEDVINVYKDLILNPWFSTRVSGLSNLCPGASRQWQQRQQQQQTPSSSTSSSRHMTVYSASAARISAEGWHHFACDPSFPESFNLTDDGGTALRRLSAWAAARALHRDASVYDTAPFDGDGDALFPNNRPPYGRADDGVKMKLAKEDEVLALTRHVVEISFALGHVVGYIATDDMLRDAVQVGASHAAVKPSATALTWWNLWSGRLSPWPSPSPSFASDTKAAIRSGVEQWFEIKRTALEPLARNLSRASVGMSFAWAQTQALGSRLDELARCGGWATPTAIIIDNDQDGSDDEPTATIFLQHTLYTSNPDEDAEALRQFADMVSEVRMTAKMSAPFPARRPVYTTPEAETTPGNEGHSA
ncbi:hypothetical protein ColTof4_14440 [Colletotrichum tofieldiae]|nr:hypothetical protein ColTof4_14440 [Colletotrichum tofieldiae]